MTSCIQDLGWLRSTLVDVEDSCEDMTLPTSPVAEDASPNLFSSIGR